MLEGKNELLTEKQVAELLKCSTAKLANDRFYKRGIPYYKFRHAVRYRAQDVLEYVESCRVVPSRAKEKKSKIK